MSARADVIVAGHICLDVIPAIGAGIRDLGELFAPGRLVEVGRATVSTGGAVSNTGLSLHRLGVSTRLMGKVGDDLWGRAILRILEEHDPELSLGMVVDPGEETSYTVVLSVPGHDRIFLHAPGANDTYSLRDIAFESLRDAKVFHFGYPPLMARMYQDGGEGLAEIFRRAKEAGLVTSLDMAMPDPNGPSGKADWRAILPRVLPHVDVFLPSMEEMLLMLKRDVFHRLSHDAGSRSLTALVTEEMAADLADEILSMGARIVGLKAGDQGLYLRTASKAQLAEALSPERCSIGVDLDRWAGRELWIPCFDVEVAGTTGSGDATVAGFLAGLIEGGAPEQVMELAVAVGACSVEATDATSGVPSRSMVRERIRKGWAKRPLHVGLSGWRRTSGNSSGPAEGLWASPRDPS